MKHGDSPYAEHSSAAVSGACVCHPFAVLLFTRRFCLSPLQAAASLRLTSRPLGISASASACPAAHRGRYLGPSTPLRLSDRWRGLWQAACVPGTRVPGCTAVSPGLASCPAEPDRGRRHACNVTVLPALGLPPCRGCPRGCHSGSSSTGTRHEGSRTAASGSPTNHNGVVCLHGMLLLMGFAWSSLRFDASSCLLTSPPTFYKLR
jgi:hypothetical protein